MIPADTEGWRQPNIARPVVLSYALQILLLFGLHPELVAYHDFMVGMAHLECLAFLDELIFDSKAKICPKGHTVGTQTASCSSAAYNCWQFCEAFPPDRDALVTHLPAVASIRMVCTARSHLSQLVIGWKHLLFEPALPAVCQCWIKRSSVKGLV